MESNHHDASGVLAATSIVTTISGSVFTAFVLKSVTAFAYETSIKCMGATMPLPTQFLMDAAAGGRQAAVLAVPMLLAVVGEVMRRRSRPRTATVLLVVAPQVSWFLLAAGLGALLLPLFAVADCGQPPR